MPTVPLPERPNLDHLKAQARSLQRSVRAGEPAAVARVAEHHPDRVPAPEDLVAFPLSAAQVVVAREHGFASWPRLKHHVELVTELTRAPDEVTTEGDAAADFLTLACLVYSGADGPDRWAAARGILAAHPEILDAGLGVAATLADVDAVTAALDRDPAAASRELGPHRWPPLLYLCYSRVDARVSEAAVLATARALLDAGADPDAGFLHHGLPTPFTALTGAFGEGEQGPVRQPRHPHSLALARVLLEAGADPNDGQTLYNRMFEPGDDHLELLFASGLGRGSGGPWHHRLGDALESPAEMVRGQLAWAVSRDFPERVALLIDHGVDVVTPFGDGRTPVAVAARAGNLEIVARLTAAGAPAPALTPAESVVAAALAGDRAAVEELVAASPGALSAARAERPAAILEAAHGRRADAVALLGERGFDVNAGAARGSGFVVGSTALHHAAADGDLELCRVLLALGADPDRRDAAFDATPLGWAEHGDQTDVVALLRPLTTGSSAP